MKILVSALFLTLWILFAPASVAASERSRKLLDIDKRLPFSGPPLVSIGEPVILPPFQVKGLRDGAVSERTMRDLERLFETKHDGPAVIEVSSRKPSFLQGFETSSIAELSLRGTELRKLRDGFDLGGLGTFYIHSGVRWHVGGDRYLSRGLSSSHGGAAFDQTYSFKDQNDLAREFFKKPLQRLLNR